MYGIHNRRPGDTSSVLSIYREVKNNMAVNMPILAMYLDYKKAYDI